MSFGEHLDELRRTLWKAIIAILIGFLIGLLVGDNLIRFIQTPLNAGLETLIRSQKMGEFDKSRPETTDLEEQLLNNGMTPDVVTVNPQELTKLLAEMGVEVKTPQEMPQSLPLTIWRGEVEGAQTIATNVLDGFSVYIKASLVVGLVIASPFVFYFVWTFVASGLYPHEKKYVHIFMPFSIGLFLLGATVAFFGVIKFVLDFLFQFYDWMGINPMPRISEWLNFVLILPVMFGVAFQLPLIMLFLERIQVFSTSIYIKYWRYAILVIFFLSMVLTPADPQSMLLMAGCLTPLYFGGILLCKYMPRSQSPLATQLDKA